MHEASEQHQRHQQHQQQPSESGGIRGGGGGGGDKSRKMAKKNAPAALQTDVSQDEDWAKILERKGLVVADVYSDWSGPCVGMVSILKKIKMEIGGDNLSYATARCDQISSLARFRGQSEPTWMFIRDGTMVNLLFGASCPRLTETLTEELRRLQTGQQPRFSLAVEQMCEDELARARDLERKRTAKHAQQHAQREAERRRKYEAELQHYVDSLHEESLLVLLPWLFRDEEGNKRDKRSTPAYVELAEQLLPEHFSVEREVRMQLEEAQLAALQRETRFELSNESRRLLMDGKCLCMRLKVVDKVPQTDIDSCLLELLFSEPSVPRLPDDLVDGCFVQRYLPPSLRDFIKDTMSLANDPDKLDKLLCVTTVWLPLNPRNKAIAFRALFPKYVQDTYPYEDADASVPVTLFKYDSTKVRELQMVHQMYKHEVVKHGIFERDKLPDPKLLAQDFDEFDQLPKELHSTALFVWVVKRSGINVFLSFAGIGPNYVSETPEKAVEDAEQYFPRKSTVSEEVQSDEEEKAAAAEEEQQPAAAAAS